MKKPINSEHIEGRIYQHDLSIKQVQNRESENYGKSYISGNIYVAVDEEGLNVIPIHFTYVTERTKAGSINQTYLALETIINGKAWITDGKEEAVKVSANTSIASNDFYNQNDELISTMVNENGFVNVVNTLAPIEKRNTFQMDMYINKTILTEKDEGERFLTLKGFVFNFKKQIIPSEFVVKNEVGIEHFLNMGISKSEPVFIKIWGKINNTTTTITREEETAFGETFKVEFEKKSKEWIITGTSKEPYEYGDENYLTNDEMIKASQEREIFLAEKKRQSDEWRAKRDNDEGLPFATDAMASPIPKGGFAF